MKKLPITLLMFFMLSFQCFAKINVFSYGNKNNKKIALTFDDGPNDSSLPKILDLLKEEKIKASFFFIGKNIASRKIEVERVYNEGHLVLNHSYGHTNFTTSSKEDIVSEISKTNNVIKDILGIEPTLYRPPYGIITENVKKAIKKLDMSVVLWNVDGEDWNNKRTVKEIIDTQKEQTKNGSIILMHTQPEKNTSYEALIKLIPYYRDKGFEFVTLEELLDIKAYK